MTLKYHNPLEHLVRVHLQFISRNTGWHYRSWIDDQSEEYLADQQFISRLQRQGHHHWFSLRLANRWYINLAEEL